ncbi:calcium-binding protein [Falsiroseomonas oryzae]|uniref:calcium-binding protein n=1 Tax=Falsiroseomonas oryzae TaxID=2766473 RepID=UPI0022EB5AD1|nr:right-handed parallel beta-helix repeat-containing protein [Roseomonas sp. MO-31]
MPVLTVGSGQQYDTISSAIAASRDGDVIQVQAGTYTNDFAEIRTDVSLVAVGGVAHLKATTAPPNGKAILTTNADVTIQGFEFSGAAVPDQNGAGIRHESGNLVIEDSRFHDNENGILTIASNRDATLTIRDSEFDHNGRGDGRTHNIYVGDIGKLTVENSYFHEASVGHELKSRAQETIITGSRFADFDATASYSIDLPNGGRAVLRDNVLQQGPNSENPVIVSFGVEGNVHANSSLEMTGNTVIDEHPSGRLLWNATGVPATVSDTEVFGLTADQLVSGPANVSGTTFLASAPAFDTSAPWQPGAAPPAPAPDPVTDPDPVEEQPPVTQPPPVDNPDPDDEVPPVVDEEEPIEEPVPDEEEPIEEPVPDEEEPDVVTPPETDDPDEPAETRLPTMGPDVLVGSAEADSLAGRGGDDDLQGGAGDDLLRGGRGKDRLEGDAGDDRLLGGADDDTFVFGEAFGNDLVAGFEAHGDAGGSHDLLDISALGVTAGTFDEQVTIEARGNGALVSVADHGTIALPHLKPEALDSSDFILA